MPDTEKALGLSVLSTIRDWVKSLNTALTTQEINDAVDAGWGNPIYTLTPKNRETFYDAFDSSTNTFGNQITEAGEGDNVYVLAEAPYSMYSLQIKDTSTGTVLTTGTFIKTISTGVGCVFSFVMPAANITINFSH